MTFSFIELSVLLTALHFIATFHSKVIGWPVKRKNFEVLLYHCLTTLRRCDLRRVSTYDAHGDRDHLRLSSSSTPAALAGRSSKRSGPINCGICPCSQVCFRDWVGMKRLPQTTDVGFLGYKL